MKKFDFTEVSNEELLQMEQKIDIELGKVLLEMRYNEELENMYQELEAIKEEKSRRDI